MRADADLCFLERVGMPDVTALSAEQGSVEVAADVTDRYMSQQKERSDFNNNQKKK